MELLFKTISLIPQKEERECGSKRARESERESKKCGEEKCLLKLNFYVYVLSRNFSSCAFAAQEGHFQILEMGLFEKEEKTFNVKLLISLKFHVGSFDINGQLSILSKVRQRGTNL